MRRFLIISWACLLVSCGGSLPSLENFSAKKVPVSEYAVNPYFSNLENSHVYKTDISVYGKKLNGVLAIKKINDSLRRAALLSDFGVTLLDVEFGENHRKVNYAVAKLDRKIIVNTLVEDFRLLTREKRRIVKAYKNKAETLLKTSGKNGFVYCFYDRKSQHLTKLVKTGKRQKKSSIFFADFKNGRPQKIQISHHRLKLEIVLNALN